MQVLRVIKNWNLLKCAKLSHSRVKAMYNVCGTCQVYWNLLETKGKHLSSKKYTGCAVLHGPKAGPNFIELLKQTILLTNVMLSKSYQNPVRNSACDMVFVLKQLYEIGPALASRHKPPG